MSSVARLCVLVLTVLFQVSVWQLIWPSPCFASESLTSRAASPTVALMEQVGREQRGHGAAGKGAAGKGADAARAHDVELADAREGSRASDGGDSGSDSGSDSGRGAPDGAPQDGAPQGSDAPEGKADERSAPMADDILEDAMRLIAVHRVGVDAGGRSGLARDELRRGNPALDTPDKPPRAPAVLHRPPRHRQL